MDYTKDARSLGDLLRLSCAHWGDRTAMLRGGKGGFTPLSYRDLYATVKGYAAALQGLGLRAGDRMLLISDNCIEWAFCDWAAQTLGVVLVPVYPTLPAELTRYIATDCGATHAIVGSLELAKKLEGLPGLASTPLAGEGSLDQLARTATLDQVAWEAAMRATDPEETATIIYTSGTTGNPKGVMLAHRSFIFLCTAIRQTIPVDENDVFLSFLPLSHVYERFAGHVMPIAVGATIAHAQSLASLASDMVAVRPTIMCCVPRFLESVRGRIVDAAEGMPPIRRRLFHAALRVGAAKFKGGSPLFLGLLDKLVLQKIRARTGGRIRFFVSGGAALPPHVAEFYGALGLRVLQGYGLTETTAATTFNHPDRSKYDTIGEPIQGVEVTVAEDGELLVRGPSLMKGYYNLPEETASVVDADGWFHTGDIGKWEGQRLKITDRKKDLIVLANGKNVPPQPIENLIRESEYIAEAVLFGDGMDYVVGLIVPDFDRVKRFAKGQGIATESPEELIKLEPVRALIKGELDAVNKRLADYERVKRHELLTAPFTVDSGELTPTFKVRRKIVREKYASVIAGMERA
jgi:long-chain acyl-CoA synthetase